MILEPRTHQAIPLSQLTHYPSFLSGHSTEPGLLLNEPLSELTALRSLERFTAEHRTALVAALGDDLRRWDAPERARAAVELLGGGEAYAVVTGQQAGIATGPLYTLYKALGAVRAAERLGELHPDHHFVPVFWIEADDHDFDEARALAVLNRTGEPVELAYTDAEARSLPVGDRAIDADGIATLTAALREALPPTEFIDDALAMLEEVYREGTLADGFARMLYAILGDTPLVLASSRNPALKRLAADIVACDAENPTLLFDAVEKRTAELRERGLPTPITPKPGGLFIVHEGERRRLEYTGDRYRVSGTEITMSVEEAARAAREHPERFSPNVALRPLVQDAIFPTAIYLGGPSEVAYLNQLTGAYAAFDITPPAIAPRPFVLLLEPKAQRAIDTSGIALDELLRHDFDTAAHVLDEAADAEIEETRARAATAIDAAFTELGALTTRIDLTLEKSLGAAVTAAQKGLDDLTKRLRAALKRKHQTEIDRIEGGRMLLLPKGKLQERTLSPLYYIDKFGLERFRAALDRIELQPGMLQVIEI